MTAMGMITEARPWADGRPAARARRGVILREVPDGGYLVWFPTLGEPLDMGRAVQAFRPGEFTDPRPADEAPVSWLRKARDGMRRHGDYCVFKAAYRRVAGAYDRRARSR